MINQTKEANSNLETETSNKETNGDLGTEKQMKNNKQPTETQSQDNAPPQQQQTQDNIPTKHLDWLKIQDKWQKKWADAKLGEAKVDKNKEKFMMIFAYPSVSGFLHVGHLRGFSYTDAISRYERLNGKEVLFPVGTHASGNQAFSFAKKIKENDQEWISYLLNNGCTKEKLKELTDPNAIIEYFNEVYVNDYFKKFGFLCDWERFLCSTHKDYEKFIQWQFKKLHDKNLLTQKPYFATACVNCGPVAVDPSETDISKGGNAEKQEYTLLKFKYKTDNQGGFDYLVTATLRPETVYGQTNIWINPNAKYVRVEVDNENWIMSKKSADKLKFQKDDVILKEDVDPKKYLGKSALAPGVEREIPILPATFCDPDMGSGIVTCVPSDAPYDYVALKTLQDNQELCKKYGLDFSMIKEIRLIPIIKSKRYGPFPAQEIVEKMGITSLDDDKLEEATQEIYKAGFHTGIMVDSCGKYAGKRVEEAKELMKAEMLDLGKADIMHDLSEEVICRCGGKVIIKRIDDQWFIKYSNPELTEKSKKQVKEMSIYPAEYQEHLPGTLDWFAERACTRLGNWMGSKFPFDDKWTVEPISDSTLYPIYYIVSKWINNGTLDVEELTEEFFDYVYLGKSEEIGVDEDDKKAKIKKWSPIKEEFDYFYPLDINLGGKEHKTVHFPVFLMNHVAILPEQKWPKGIFVNWWVTGKGSKISKSKGGAVPIPDAMEKYGIDAMRLYYSHIGSPHVDIVWTAEIVINYKNILEKIGVLVESVKSLESGGKKNGNDYWILSRIHGHLKEIKQVMKHYGLRELASTVYFTVYEDIKWYLRRGGDNKKIISEVMDIWFKIMNPITPHLSEEMNEIFGGKSKELVSASDWPEYENEKISLGTEANDEMVKTTMTGMRNVLKLAKLEKAKKYQLFIAEKWLYELYEIVSREIKVTRNVGEIMKTVLAQESMKPKGKEVSKLVISLIKNPSRMPKMVTSQEEELVAIKEAQGFLESEFGCTVEIVSADESDEPKAKSAMPGKVGILVE